MSGEPSKQFNCATVLTEHDLTAYRTEAEFRARMYVATKLAVSLKFVFDEKNSVYGDKVPRDVICQWIGEAREDGYRRGFMDACTIKPIFPRVPLKPVVVPPVRRFLGFLWRLQ